MGVTDIVALRGDPASGAANFAPHPDGFGSSVELITALAKSGTFNIRVAAYPETHPEAASGPSDLDWLKAKIDAGASSAITQFFFEAETFLRFRDKCVKAGINVPIIPGILPVTDWQGTRRFARRCGTKVPANLSQAWERAIRDDRQDLFALTQCATLCSALIDDGVEHLHFFTLNKPERTRDVLMALGFETASAEIAVA